MGITSTLTVRPLLMRPRLASKSLHFHSCYRLALPRNSSSGPASPFFSSSSIRNRPRSLLQGDGVTSYGAVEGESTSSTTFGTSFLLLLALALGVAAALTAASVYRTWGSSGSFFNIQNLKESSFLDASPVGFSIKAFGYRIILPERAPGWVYFWLLMLAGCGLFVSEEALNIWIGISLSKMLLIDGTWQSFVESFSRNCPYIISTVVWVYWGVCISDMIPFYLGRIFSRSGAPQDICSKLGIGKERVKAITSVILRYKNLVGVVERFSIGVRNPTAFLAGTLNISPECFFGGVCIGGFFTLSLQLGIGFLLRERPVFAFATVATAVGIWTIFPYVLAASTALFIFLRDPSK